MISLTGSLAITTSKHIRILDLRLLFGLTSRILLSKHGVSTSGMDQSQTIKRLQIALLIRIAVRAIHLQLHAASLRNHTIYVSHYNKILMKAGRLVIMEPAWDQELDNRSRTPCLGDARLLLIR